MQVERKLGDESSEGTGEVDGEDERKRGGDGVRDLVVCDVTNCNGQTSVSGLETEDPASLEVVVSSEAEEGGTYRVSGTVSDQS